MEDDAPPGTAGAEQPGAGSPRAAATGGAADLAGSRAVLADPRASSDDLRAVLRAQPALAAQVAVHPRADDALLRDLEALDDREVDAALQWRQPPDGGWSRALHGPETETAQGEGANPIPRLSSASSASSASESSRPRRGGRARWWVSGVVLLVALTAVVAIFLVRGATTPARTGVVAGVPAVTLSRQGPAVRWTLSTSDISAALGGEASQIEVESLAGDAQRGVVVVSALIAGSRQERVLGVDLAAGRVTWVQPGPPNGRCTGRGDALRCTDATAPTVCAVAPSGTATAALCTSRVDGEAGATSYDLVQGSAGERVSPLIGVHDGDPLVVGMLVDPVTGKLGLEVRREGAVRWVRRLPAEVPVPSQAVLDNSALTRFVTVLDLPRSLGLVAVHVAAGVTCTHFSGDGGECPYGTTDDRGTTLLLDQATGAVRGALHGEAQLPVGDGWYVETATGLQLQHADGSAVADPRGLRDGTVVAVADRVVVVSRVSRQDGHTLTAVSRDDGTQVWTQSGDALAVDGDLLVVRPAGDEGAVHAIDIDSGAQAWNATADRDARVWGPYLGEVTSDGVTLLAPAASSDRASR